MNELQNNPLSGRPLDIPGWAPFDLSTLTMDHIAREYCRIAFDAKEKSTVRLKALKDLGQHLGMFIERKDVRTLDVTKQAALTEAFEQIPIEERIHWLDQQLEESPTTPVQQQAILPPATPDIITTETDPDAPKVPAKKAVDIPELFR